MAYIVIEIQKAANGTVSTLVTQYNDRHQAEAKYHTILAAAAVSSLPVHGAVILTEMGEMLASTMYRANANA